MRIAWCRKPDEPASKEQLLTEREEQIPAAVKWAKAQGYVVRIAEIDLTVPPDFRATVNV